VGTESVVTAATEGEEVVVGGPTVRMSESPSAIVIAPPVLHPELADACSDSSVLDPKLKESFQ
jgi:hypothetical protein